MKKNLLAKSIAAMIGGLGLVGGAHALTAGIAGGAVNDGVTAATAMQVNTDGIGHMLVVPYFSTQNGNATLMTIMNTDMRNGKAVKVRFRGAGNSDDIFDFTLLMSPGDVWTASVSQQASSGLSVLTTTDKSCTLPFTVSGQTFVTARLTATGETTAPTAAALAEGTREGYVEIFNMANIPPTLAAVAGGALTATANPLFTAIKHVAGVAPCSSTTAGAAALNALFTDAADYTAAVALGLAVPTTGLAANWTVINVAGVGAWSGSATAIEARVVAGGAPGYGNYVLYPQAGTAVTAAAARLITADPLLRGDTAAGLAPAAPAVAAAMYDFPDFSTPYLNAQLATLAAGVATRNQAYNVTAALSVTSVSNEYVTETGLSAKTDWIFSMPTRRYNVARNYVGAGSNVYTNYAFDDTPAALAANSNFFTAAGNISTSGRLICVTGLSSTAGATGTNVAALTSGQTADREEVFLASNSSFVISPGTPAAPRSAVKRLF